MQLWGWWHSPDNNFWCANASCLLRRYPTLPVSHLDRRTLSDKHATRASHPAAPTSPSAHLHPLFSPYQLHPSFSQSSRLRWLITDHVSPWQRQKTSHPPPPRACAQCVFHVVTSLVLFFSSLRLFLSLQPPVSRVRDEVNESRSTFEGPLWHSVT